MICQGHFQENSHFREPLSVDFPSVGHSFWISKQGKKFIILVCQENEFSGVFNGCYWKQHSWLFRIHEKEHVSPSHKRKRIAEKGFHEMLYKLAISKILTSKRKMRVGYIRWETVIFGPFFEVKHLCKVLLPHDCGTEIRTRMWWVWNHGRHSYKLQRLGPLENWARAPFCFRNEQIEWTTVPDVVWGWTQTRKEVRKSKQNRPGDSQYKAIPTREWPFCAVMVPTHGTKCTRCMRYTC